MPTKDEKQSAELIEAIRHSNSAGRGVYGANRVLAICEKPTRHAVAIVRRGPGQSDQDDARLKCAQEDCWMAFDYCSRSAGSKTYRRREINAAKIAA